ncbi:MULTISPECIES: PH domain-containing protein [Anaeromyxobacter]|uniref:PH domain-containing protein n=1 Tax=Anaeromyxobacter TaxID=161492 RepID=UPI001F584374|nr:MULTISPECIES: PH domain-containing protein [unclassified Anaeromyxobacter]
MLETAIALVALFLVMLGGRALFRRSSAAPRERASTAGGALVLRPLRRNGVMLGIGALLPTIVLAGLVTRVWVGGQTGVPGLLLGAAATLAMLAVTAHQFASAFRQRIVVHDTFIERVGVLTRRNVSWTSVSSVAYNPLQRWFYLTLSDGSHLWLSETLRGAGEFAEIALRRLPEGALRADPVAREVLEELAATAAEGARTAEADQRA